MYICAEQKPTVLFEGREIRISERAANAHFRMCNMPITESETSVYLGVTLQEAVAKLPRFTDELLTWLIEVNVMDELESLNLEWFWELPNEPSIEIDLVALTRYASSTGRTAKELTAEEVERFRTKEG